MKLIQKSQVLCIVSLAIVVSAILVSCNKDSDLLSDFIARDTNQDLAANFIVDDNFTVIPGGSQTLDVLGNDNFSDSQEITITNISNPTQGDITLNEDNTIEYVAPDSASDSVLDTSSDSTPDTSSDDTSSDSTPDTSSDSAPDTSSDSTSDTSTDSTSEIIDTFTYTIETEDDNGELISDTGNVTIVVTTDPIPDTDPISDVVNGDNYLFTDQAKNTLRERFENGYIAGPGFNDDIAHVISTAATFVSDPDQYRPVFGELDFSQSWNGEINNSGHSLHTTAVYAYAIDDVSIANTVATELLGTVDANDLYTSYWNNSSTLRWDNEDENHWVMSTKAKKMKDSYYFIKNLQTVLTDVNKVTIEAWFQRFAELGYNALRERMPRYYGANWEFNGISKFNNEGIYPPEYGNPKPIQDGLGNDLFTMSWAQDNFNNRNYDIIAYLHSWAVGANNLEIEHWSREFFKITIKYGLFSDGTFWEMQRATDDDPTKGVYYSWVTIGEMVEMAHVDAMANHFPNDRLYDYSTTEGILSGSTNLTAAGYAGSSTTDGTTEKSLLTFLTAQSKYLRTAANGGWNDVRFLKNSSNTLIPLSTVGTRQPSAVPAMANLYYKSQDLEDLYLYNTAVGYPPKVSIEEGYMSGVADEDSGPWGNLIFGSMWYGQENNFFN